MEDLDFGDREDERDGNRAYGADDDSESVSQVAGADGRFAAVFLGEELIVGGPHLVEERDVHVDGVVHPEPHGRGRHDELRGPEGPPKGNEETHGEKHTAQEGEDDDQGDGKAACEDEHEEEGDSEADTDGPACAAARLVLLHGDHPQLGRLDEGDNEALALRLRLRDPRCDHVDV